MMFNSISNIVIKVSNSCNLRCSYCFESDKLKNNIFSDYKGLYSFILNKLPMNKNLTIKFTGGEPLLKYENIKNAVKQLSKIRRYKDIKLSFGISTNGYFPDELNYLIDRKLLDPEYCKISWDGLNSTSVRIPKSNYNEDILSSIRKIHNKNVLIRIAIVKENIDRLSESIEWLFKNGFISCEYYYIFNYPYYSDNLFRIKIYNEFKKIYELQKKYFGISRIENIYTCIMANKFNRFNNINILCSNIGNGIYIDGNGDIYPCQFFSEDTPYMNKSFKIGNIYDGFNYESINKFESVWKEITLPDECINCNNKQCFECPAVNLFRNKKRLMYECKLREYERIIYSDFNKYFITDK